jgi:heterogeneous nuclear ribonucleoprotein R
MQGRKLRFVPSQAKNKLFIGNVPKNWSKDEFQKVLLERGPGITNLELLMVCDFGIMVQIFEGSS